MVYHLATCRHSGGYQLLGEIERGHQNSSFQVLVKIAAALEIELSGLFRLDQEISDLKEIEKQIAGLAKDSLMMICGMCLC